MDGEKVVERIKFLIKKKNISVQEFKKDCHLPNAVLSRFKIYNNCPSADTALEIAHYFGVTVEWLFTGNDPIVDAALSQPLPPQIPPEILSTAYEIQALPDVFRNSIYDIIRNFKKQCSALERDKHSAVS